MTRYAWLDRWLLVMVIVLQLVMIYQLMAGRTRQASPPSVSNDSTSQRQALHDPADTFDALLELHQNKSRFPDVFERFFHLASRQTRLFREDPGWNRLMISPGMNIQHGDDAYDLVFSIPSADPDQLKVQMDGHMLTVWAVCGENDQFPTRQVYKRQVFLPEAVAVHHEALALWTNGLLRVRIPKGSVGPSYRQHVMAIDGSW